jgi:hypothetical protein
MHQRLRQADAGQLVKYADKAIQMGPMGSAVVAGAIVEAALAAQTQA